MSRISKGGWVILYIGTGLLDIAQALITFFSVPLSAFVIGAVIVAANEAADPFIGAFLAAQFQLRGVSMITRPGRLGSLLGVVIIEELSLGIAPFWIVDIWYIHHDVRKEETGQKAIQTEQKLLENRREQALNTVDEDGNGVRLPNDQSPARTANRQNIDGIRASM
jgi:hypothetical protein